MAEIPVKPEREGAKSKTWAWWIIVAIVIILLFFLFSGRSRAGGTNNQSMAYADVNIPSVSACCPPVTTLKQAA